MAKEYRLVILPKRLPRGPWRADRQEAILDAIQAKLAFTDDDRPGQILWHPLGHIEERDTDVASKGKEKNERI